MASSGNFATLNPLVKYSIGTFSNGNLTYASGSDDGYTSTIDLNFKSYCEVRVDAISSSGGTIGFRGATDEDEYFDVVSFQENFSSGKIYHYKGNSSQSVSTADIGGTVSAGNIVMMAYDPATYKWWVGVNGTWRNSGDPANGTGFVFQGSATMFENMGSIHWGAWNGTNTHTITFNFGQDSTFGGQETAGGNADGNGFGDFKYSVPTGFLATCSGNIAISDDIDPAQDTGPNTHFDVVTYTGNGGTQSITSLGFQPDWTLIKNRASGDWCNQNSSLGVGESQKWNDDGGVSTDTDAVTSFNSDGFSLGADSKVNTSSANYVAYCWKKSAEAGLDIVTYSGSGGSQAVSHSLGVTPDCIFIMLNTGTALDSIMYLNSASMGTSYGIFPTSADARQNTTYVSATTSSNFTVTGSADTSGRTYFAYVLKSIEGFSKFGEYIANANTDGPFTYLGFRPRLIIIKALESGQTWFFFDTARSTHNVIDLYLYGQRNLAESTAGAIDIDFLSNGFKIRSSGVDLNSSSGQAYAYLAWADVPFKYNNTF
jgi:hypothetical protein